jgi:2-polyprenyl-3-methyl-5-hydroxy-6-metoxy-1,4-benzoquinol methylase
MMDFSHRSQLPEEMDAPTTDAQTYAICLADLASVNRVTFTHRPVVKWLRAAVARLPAGHTIRILDVACGQGDLLRAIARWAAKNAIPVRLEGLDLNPRSAVQAAAVTPPEMDITYHTADVFTFVPENEPDFIVSSQFAHHLTDEEVVHLLRWMDHTALHGWFIADLHRHPLAYYGFPLLARLARWHRIVRKDGQISIARSFRRPDWEMLLNNAGLSATVAWSLPFRYCVGGLK